MGIGERLAVPRRKSMQRSMTLLVPLAGAARTGIVPPGLRMRLRSAFRRLSKRRKIFSCDFGMRVIGAERLLPDGQRALEERSGALIGALGVIEPGEVVQRVGHVGVIGAECLLADGQRALIKRSGALIGALGVIECGKVVQRAGDIRVIGAERLLPDGQRALQKRPARS